MSEGYILNTVQTPGPLRVVYKSIRRGNTTKEKILDDTDLSESLLKQGISGLQEIGLIGREEPDYYTVNYPWDTGNDDLNFRMAVLHELANDADRGNWGKQSVVLLNYQYLLQKNVQTFESDSERIYREMNSFARDKGYEPRSQQGVIDMNQPKLVNWTRIADFLGLVYKAQGKRHIVYPDEEMIYQSIILASRNTNTSPMEIRDYIRWLNQNLLLVEMTDDGEIPEPLSRVLFNLVADERIRIVEVGDAAAVGLQGVPSQPGIDTEANSIEVIS
ncbi:hypothetical protein ACEU6E_07105 [Halorutilales archaeon Cl-col2-1]